MSRYQIHKYSPQTMGLRKWLTDRTIPVSNYESRRAYKVMADNILNKFKVGKFRDEVGGNTCELCSDRVKKFDPIQQSYVGKHGFRILRHDKLAGYLKHYLTKHGSRIISEPIL
ncbi:unnamed protein product [Lepeophtheirus salmonis]|uniref:(salmon louse) hypothetical protein n=1 Tax=Lepeophtheirus salmonis TaxID=72036 RepID=A0A7R8H0X3_LEPSM|nr:unnamed protein product [Lepeophtheirus salmonis]CAF2797600.1 unnamed protein product [Lepeophtheirus salmonis]